MTYGAANSISWAVWEDGKITISGGAEMAKGSGEAAPAANAAQTLDGIGSVS